MRCISSSWFAFGLITELALGLFLGYLKWGSR